MARICASVAVFILIGTMAVVLLVVLLVAGVVDEDGGGAGSGAIKVLLAAVAVSCVVSDLGVHATTPSPAQRVNDVAQLIKRIIRTPGSCIGAFDAWVDDRYVLHLVQVLKPRGVPGECGMPITIQQAEQPELRQRSRR